MVDEVSILHARIRQLEDELTSVRAEAVEAVSFWGEFASNYSKAHHHLADDIASLRGKEAGASPSETPLRVQK